MATVPSGIVWRASLRPLAMVIPFLLLAPVELKAEVSHEAPKIAPQDPRPTTQDRRSGETLSEQLNRNSGVIRPPDLVDPSIAVPPPDGNPHGTPVIPPPGTPGGNQSIQPK